MGRWKPKNTLPIGRLAPSRAMAAETVAQLTSEGGPRIQTRATPRDRVPISGIVAALVEPFRTEVSGGAELRQVKTLATMAALAWNISRFERMGDKGAALVATAWDHIRAMADGVAEPIVERMLAQARTMYPDDTRIVVNTRVESDGRHLDIQAASVEG